MKTILGRIFWLLFAFALAAPGAVVVPPTIDWVSLPSTATVGQTVSVGVGAHSNPSDDGSLNVETKNMVARIMIDLQRPGQSDWTRLHDWFDPYRTPADAWTSFVVTNPGTHTVRVELMDGRPWYSTVLYYQVSAPNPQPIMTSQTSVTYDQLQPVSFGLAATSSPTSFSATNLPPGLLLNTSTGVISGGVGIGGTWTSTVSATNAYGQGPAQTLSWTIRTAAITATPSTDPSSATISYGSSILLYRAGSTNFAFGWTEGTIWYPTGGYLAFGRLPYGSMAYTPDQGPGLYTWQFRVADYWGNFNEVNVQIQALPPPAPPVPAGLTASATSATSIQLNWNASPGATGYGIYRGGSLITSITGTSYIDAGRSPNTAYQYTVASYNSYNIYSNQSGSVSVTTPPTQPVGLTGTPRSNGTVDLTWTATPGAASYVIYRQGSQLAAPASASYIDTTGTLNTSYSYTVLAINSAGVRSVQSVAISVLTAPAVPTGLISTGAAPTTVGLRWNPVLGAASYVVFRNGAPAGTPAGLVFTDSGLTASTAYSYTVAATNAQGTRSLASAAISVTTPAVALPILVVAAPTGITPTAVTSTSLTFNWTPVIHSVGIARYDVYSVGVLVGSPQSASFTHTGRAFKTTYVYKIVAVDVYGNRSVESAPISMTTEANGGTLPSGYQMVLAVPSGAFYGIKLSSWEIATVGGP